MKIARAGLLLAGMLTFAAATADAAVVIVFDNGGTSGGTVSYGGGLATDPLVGTGITFDIVTVDDGVNPVTNLTCVDCELNFTTGVSNFESAGLVSFTGGGTFTITGDIFDGATLVASGDLAVGSFSGLQPALASGGAGGIVSILGGGVDTKHEDLLDYFGFSAEDFIHATTAISAIDCDTNLADGFTCRTLEEADVTNTQLVAPEPGSLALFGMALIGAGRAARRRFARK